MRRRRTLVPPEGRNGASRLLIVVDVKSTSGRSSWSLRLFWKERGRVSTEKQAYERSVSLTSFMGRVISTSRRRNMGCSLASTSSSCESSVRPSVPLETVLPSSSAANKDSE